jgi:hypothetical protein
MDFLESLPSVWSTIAGIAVAGALAGLWHTRSSWRLRLSAPRWPRRAVTKAARSAPPARLTSEATWTKLSRIIEDAVQRTDVMQNAQRASALQIDAAELALRRLLTEARLVMRQPIVMFEAVPVLSGPYRSRGEALAA